jgi:DNA modification methylase
MTAEQDNRRFLSRDGITLWQHDARRVSEIIEPESVDLLICSPPYFALRSYTDGGEHYDGQMGSEATPREFVDNLIAATADWVKVLKPTGSIWVNLGDKFSGSGGNNNSNLGERATLRGPSAYNQASDGIPAKSLMGLPWRYANRVVDELGLILRECIIWQKPNGLPESATDRCRVSHEYLFHFTRQGRYFAALDEIREEYADPVDFRAGKGNGSKAGVVGVFPGDSRPYNGGIPGTRPERSSLGKLPGSVWSIPSEPLVVPDHLGVDHFAAFPSELPRRIILAFSPKAYCTVCDEPRRAVVEKEAIQRAQRSDDSVAYAEDGHAAGRSGFTADVRWMGENVATITGYACACPTNDAPTRPSVVLDPFIGTGTTAAVAKALGRNAIGVDLSRDYLRLAEWRVNDPGIARKVRTRSNIATPKAPAIDGQMSLLDGAA